MRSRSNEVSISDLFYAAVGVQHQNYTAEDMQNCLRNSLRPIMELVAELTRPNIICLHPRIFIRVYINIYICMSLGQFRDIIRDLLLKFFKAYLLFYNLDKKMFLVFTSTLQRFTAVLTKKLYLPLRTYQFTMCDSQKI